MSETVNKALDLLELFLDGDGELNLAELASLSGYNKATAYRLVSTLARRGYIHQRERKGAYSLGFKTLDFTCAIRKNFKFIDIAYLYLSKLSKARNISAYLAILDSDSSLVIEEIALVETMRINSPIGKRMPLYATASGRVLLASLTGAERDAYYRRNTLRPLTAKTITEPAELEKEIEKIQREGVALSEEDYKNGLMSVAAPLYNGNQDIIAAAGIIAPVAQFDDCGRDKLTAELKSCTAEISQVISRIG